jgi:heme exporter protein A
MLLVVDRLTVERGGRTVLTNLSFTLPPGEAILARGRNGAGKSTLLRALAGLLPFQGGRILAPGADAEIRAAELIHYVGYEDALKPALSVGENLEFWTAMLAGPAAVAEPGSGLRLGLPVRDALGAFGIARLADLPAGYLSAGQKRRVALARLLLNPRPIWLLDEPLIALDLSAQETLANLMATHVAKGGGIVAASHAPLGLAARALDLDAGDRRDTKPGATA